MAPTLGWPLSLSWLESHVPASVKYVAVIIVALVATTLIFLMMLPTSGCLASSSITQAEMRSIDQLCHEANAMAKHHHHHASLLNSSIKQVNCVGGMAGIEPTLSKSNDWTLLSPCQLGQEGCCNG